METQYRTSSKLMKTSKLNSSEASNSTNLPDSADSSSSSENIKLEADDEPYLDFILSDEESVLNDKSEDSENSDDNEGDFSQDEQFIAPNWNNFDDSNDFTYLNPSTDNDIPVARKFYRYVSALAAYHQCHKVASSHNEEERPNFSSFDNMND
ncbi:2081_t:CDS:2 [Funneliformis mosseae]|uniref:2081_t:CDS:1 n=1 Tax=Funneliformis mosseae TaxID=27381 RepID=A0A9N9CTP7_FUNMO|nr:2081_t:CDS:2 [Funneliformis mosseae]